MDNNPSMQFPCPHCGEPVIVTLMGAMNQMYSETDRRKMFEIAQASSGVTLVSTFAPQGT